jgi:ferric hydroxamate transport system substrate-binding protein
VVRHVSTLAGISLLIVALILSACTTSENDTEEPDGSGEETTTETTEESADESEATETEEPTTETSGTETDEEPTVEAAATNDADSDSEAAGERVIEHAIGETSIQGVPERIVALEWTYAEDLLALGIQPAGVADIEGYQAWVNIEEELSGDVTDVGTRQEPSLESIAQLEPDLIIGVQFRHEAIYDQLSDIAPTLIFNPYPEDESVSQFDEMEQTMMRIAEAVDRTDEGEAVLEDMYAAFDEIRTEIESADVETDFVLTQAFTSDSSPQMRVFIDSSMAVQILESLGMNNAWEGEFDIYGFNTVGIEALTTVDEASFFYVAQDDDNPFEEQWSDHPVWNDLTFVQDERVYPLGGDTWLFGGPLSAEVLANQVLEILTSDA